MLPLFISACQTFTHNQSVSDNRIKIVQNDGKTITVPPKCIDWEKGWGHPLSNDAWPSFGCANASNLAAQVENPLDLVDERDLDSPDPITATAAIARYQSGKTTPFIDPNAENPADIRKMEDTRIGGAPTK